MCDSISRKMKNFGLEIKAIFKGDRPLLELALNEGTTVIVSSLSELFDEIRKIGRQGLQIQRYKGLGEMNADQLWDTTMDPNTRKMIKVTMEDAFQAERIFTLLMGDEIEPRREYIEKFAATVRDLDI